MRHRGVHVGNFYLAEKEGGEEFTSEDEETLVLFASQAATAIANARTYRDEQARARRPGGSGRDLARRCPDLRCEDRQPAVAQSRVETDRGEPVHDGSPSGRFAGGDHLPARRWAGDCPRTDSPLAGQLSSAETVRGEEIVLSTPDGRSVKTLINATPIHAEDGTVRSVVVTIQDLAPLEELDRMRAEFLGMVSHELRTPLTSIKGSTATVLGRSRVFGPAEMLQFFRIIDEQAEHMSGLIGDLLDAGRIETGTLSVSLEPSEVGALAEQARNTFLSGDGRHPILIDLPQDLPRVTADRQRTVQILNNLLSNAAKHSPESSPIRVAAERGGVYVAVSVSDPGSRHRTGPTPAPVPEIRRRRRWETGCRRWPGPGHLQGTGRGPGRAHLGRERRRGSGRGVHFHDSGGRRSRR